MMKSGMVQKTFFFFTALIFPLCGTPLTGHLQNDFLKKTLFAKPEKMASGFAENGAVSVNARWETGESKVWFIEQQRYGGDYLMCAASTGDKGTLETGLRVVRWGMDRQDATGGFPGTGDPFHSTSMFVEAVARGLLSLEETDAKKYEAVLKELKPKLEKAAVWLLDEGRRQTAEKYSVHYTHRRWILAAGLLQAWKLTGNEALKTRALEYATLGLAMQTPEGVNPEKEGFDLNYQTFGLLLICRFLSAIPGNDPIKPKVLFALTKGMEWLAVRISESGEVDLTGSTRVGGDKTEMGRSGTPKKFGYKELLQELAFAADLLQKPAYLEKAKAVALKNGFDG